MKSFTLAMYLSMRHCSHLTSVESIHIDGKLDEDAWTSAPWTVPFTDIIGPRHWSQPWFKTQVKMRYDDTFLYVGAYVEDTDVWATLTKRNSVVFNDNDFEIFVDPVGTTHNYKEFEVNAINTTWNLLLKKPYRDGGGENSTRVDPVHGFDMVPLGLRSAVYVKGRANDPSKLARHHVPKLKAMVLRPTCTFLDGRSRVAAGGVGVEDDGSRAAATRVVLAHQLFPRRMMKDLPEENWVWSPQGQVAMHMPERWGYLRFVQADHIEDANERDDPEFPARYQAFAIYYAQKAYQLNHKRYADTIADLLPWIADKHVVSCLHVTYMNVTADGFFAGASAFGYTAHIRYDSFIHVSSTNDADEVASV
ncbi:hypothetical protein DYB36_005132 [Aphanomyces astaci]|uniref:Carbohydrate-binding domain-containing protein n=1 Tax=Aphanomyces astaci TaxID=112090 RepID=A0A397B5L6_APHAT|nr:hypothetical protein DYB36_005132 [Aphanomyces astaci]